MQKLIYSSDTTMAASVLNHKCDCVEIYSLASEFNVRSGITASESKKEDFRRRSRRVRAKDLKGGAIILVRSRHCLLVNVFKRRGGGGGSGRVKIRLEYKVIYTNAIKDRCNRLTVSPLDKVELFPDHRCTYHVSAMSGDGILTLNNNLGYAKRDLAAINLELRQRIRKELQQTNKHVLLDVVGEKVVVDVRICTQTCPTAESAIILEEAPVFWKAVSNKYVGVAFFCVVSAFLQSLYSVDGLGFWRNKLVVC
jgi:hypothetical protein